MIDSRAKGRRGQTEAKRLLLDRDWSVADLSAGISSEDILAIDPHGKAWAVEVKKTLDICAKHRAQAIKQGNNRKAPWMLMSHIAGTSAWLVQRKAMAPEIWTSKGNPHD